MVNLTSYLAARSELIEQQLDKIVPEQNEAFHSVLFQAARYSLLGGGKRLRPILTLATAEALGGNVEDALIPACALEMIHAYSLIHDDLPCMDNDDFRRGKPSLHKAFREGQAVLAGDFLLTHAFHVIASDAKLNADQKVELVNILSRRAGGEGMIAGQVMDLEAEGKTISLDMLRMIHANKTGALIKASIEFGGIVSGATAQDMHILRQFGSEIGLAFQITDDILDVTASQKKHGKTLASDVKNNKSTYVSLLGLKQAQEMAQTTFQSALKSLQGLSADTTLLAKLAERIVNRDS